jgi:ferric-dicitrate binding protein FerR (iron transport regulator)
MRRSILALGLICASISLLNSNAAAQTADGHIGAAVAVRNQVTGATQGAQERPLAVGNRIFQNERISTGATGVAQLMFTDQTTLSVGPRSQITLDRYVYDPSRSAGDVAVSFATGAMRFITGAQDPRNYQVRTTVATIGVRGTIVDLLMIDGRMFGILDEGRVIFTLANGETIELNRPGTALEFFSNGTVSQPFTWRGSYESSLGAATFPLFGNPFAEFVDFEGGDDADDPTNRTDDLNASYSQGY